MAVCVDEGFEVDDQGRLTHKICGDPAATTWPYVCAPGVGNPLRVDEACGLWVPPSVKAAVSSSTGSTSAALVNVPAAFVEIDTADLVVNNPSPCLPALVLRWVDLDVQWRLPAGSDSGAALAIDGNVIQLVQNPAPATGSVMNVHWQYSQALIGGGIIPPGGSLLYSSAISVGNGQGGAQRGQLRWTVRALALATP